MRPAPWIATWPPQYRGERLVSRFPVSFPLRERRSPTYYQLQALTLRGGNHIKPLIVVTAPKGAFAEADPEKIKGEFTALGFDCIFVLYGNNTPSKPTIELFTAAHEEGK